MFTGCNYNQVENHYHIQFFIPIYGEMAIYLHISYCLDIVRNAPNEQLMKIDTNTDTPAIDDIVSRHA